MRSENEGRFPGLPYVPAGPLESAPRGDFHPREVRREAFAAVLDGIPMGAYDHRMIAWLTDLDDPTCQAFASLMQRCREAGPPGSVTEWGVQFTPVDGEPVTLARFEGEHAEADALTMASDRPAWSAASRHVGPWIPADDPATRETEQGNG